MRWVWVCVCVWGGQHWYLCRVCVTHTKAYIHMYSCRSQNSVLWSRQLKNWRSVCPNCSDNTHKDTRALLLGLQARELLLQQAQEVHQDVEKITEGTCLSGIRVRVLTWWQCFRVSDGYYVLMKYITSLVIFYTGCRFGCCWKCWYSW